MRHPGRQILALLAAALLLTTLYAVSAFAAAGTVGTYLEEKIFSTQAAEIKITESRVESCPPGLNVEARSGGTELWLCGTPQSAGSYSCSGVLTVRDDRDESSREEAFSVSVEISEAVTPPPAPQVSVTKDPTGETVTEGGSALFIAKADNATEIVWRFVSPDSSATYNASEAAAHFPGLLVFGFDTENLSLLRIPYSLNGWKVEARFSGEGGPVTTKSAAITVNLPTPVPTATPSPVPTPTPSPSPSPRPTASPSPSPRPTASPSPTPRPTASPTPTVAPTALPTAAPVPSPSPSAEPSPSPTPEAEPGGTPGSYVVPMMIGAVVIAAMLCITVVVLAVTARRR